MNQEQAQSQEDMGNDFVNITVNGPTYSIHRGHRTVAEIKALAGVPLAYELEQNIGGVLTPLGDDGAVVIKGWEQFVGHPRSAASS